MSKKPLIGITLDWQEKGTFSNYSHYALRDHYFEAILRAGGLPFAIPHAPELAADYIAQIDGLLIPGGGFALPQEWYVHEEEAPPYKNSPRLANDIAMFQAALKAKLPFLGICAGMQILGGEMGCKLTRNVHHYIDTTIDHLNSKPLTEHAHDIAAIKGSKLYEIVGTERFSVNTHHCEAIVETSETIRISAKADDGVIEAIELNDYPFAIGLQWHPEFEEDQKDPSSALFRAFIEEAQCQR